MNTGACIWYKLMYVFELAVQTYVCVCVNLPRSMTGDKQICQWDFISLSSLLVIFSLSVYLCCPFLPLHKQFYLPLLNV